MNVCWLLNQLWISCLINLLNKTAFEEKHCTLLKVMHPYIIAEIILEEAFPMYLLLQGLRRCICWNSLFFTIVKNPGSLKWPSLSTLFYGNVLLKTTVVIYYVYEYLYYTYVHTHKIHKIQVHDFFSVINVFYEINLSHLFQNWWIMTHQPGKHLSQSLRCGEWKVAMWSPGLILLLGIEGGFIYFSQYCSLEEFGKLSARLSKPL